jgi:hypothetical protein
MYFKDALDIKYIDENLNISIVGESSQYANFEFDHSLDIWQLSPSCNIAMGDSDGVIYGSAIQLTPELAKNRSPDSLQSGYIGGNLVTDNTLFFNAYTQNFTDISEAHSLVALQNLHGYEYITNYSTEARLFSHVAGPIDGDDNCLVSCWTIFGAVSMWCKIKENVVRNPVDGTLTNIYMPPKDTIITILEGLESNPGPLYGYVTNIIDNEFRRLHIPDVLQYCDVIEVLTPQLARNMPISELLTDTVPLKLIYTNLLESEL